MLPGDNFELFYSMHDAIKRLVFGIKLTFLLPQVGHFIIKLDYLGASKS